MTRKFRSLKNEELAEHLEMSKGNLNDDDNLKSVYLTNGEIGCLVALVLKEIKSK